MRKLNKAIDDYKLYIQAAKDVGMVSNMNAILLCSYKLYVAKIFWLKVEGWYFLTPTEIMMSVAQPMKAHVIGQSLDESIVMSYYLLPSINVIN